jgi:hypothetical protein
MTSGRRHRARAGWGALIVVLAASTLGGCASDGARPATDAPAGTTAGTTAGTIDAYGGDPFVVSGTREEVCRGGAAAERPGRRALASHIDRTWPEVVDVQGYDCREIMDPTQPGCDRELEPPRSDCWSTHAAGRAIDVLVGGEPDAATPEGMALGDRIVTAFLATDAGNRHHLARIAGVQEIIWNGRCWRPADQDVASADQMRTCAIPGHANHVHLTLSDAGADGRTSWYGGTP